LNHIGKDDSSNNGSYCPIIFNYSTFDSVFRGKVKEYLGTSIIPTSKNVVCFFQCMVGNSHPVKKGNYSIMAHCLKLRKIDEVCLIFIVPNSSIKINPILISDIDPGIVIYMASFI
jgi:hypothetical protein